MMSGDQEDEIYAFTAKLESTKSFLNLLKSLNFMERANVFISQHGFKVTVEDSKCMQLSVMIEQSFFHEYTLRPGRGDEEGSDDLAFNINLSFLINSLDLFGDQSYPQLKICYKGFGNPLILYLETPGVMTDCTIRTREVEDCLDFNFATATVINKIIIFSEQFKEVVSMFDTTQEAVTIRIKEDQTQLSTTSEFGDTGFQIKQSSKLVERYNYQSQVCNKYKLRLLMQGLKPLSFSRKVSIQVDSRDFLCIQHMVQTEDEGQAFIEFYCVPDIDD